MHDGFPAYITLSNKTKNPQGWCWAHIIKGAEELIKYNKHEGEYILRLIKHVFDIAKDLSKRDEKSITEEDMDNLDTELRQIDTPYESKKCSGFVRNFLKKNIGDLFRFVIDRSVGSTNNRAERAIVTYGKVSGGQDPPRVQMILQ